MVKPIGNETSYFQENSDYSVVGKTSNGRAASFITPSSHKNKDLKIALISVAIALIAGIVLWSVGVSIPIAGLILSGKIVFGLSIGVIGCSAIAMAYLNCCK